MRFWALVLFVVVVASGAIVGLASIGACCPPASVLIGDISGALVSGSAPAADLPSTTARTNGWRIESHG